MKAFLEFVLQVDSHWNHLKSLNEHIDYVNLKLNSLNQKITKTISNWIIIDNRICLNPFIQMKKVKITLKHFKFTWKFCSLHRIIGIGMFIQENWKICLFNHNQRILTIVYQIYTVYIVEYLCCANCNGGEWWKEHNQCLTTN